MENKKQERRRAVRIKKQLLVQYQDDVDSYKWDMSGVENFSEVGMFITTQKQFPSGALLTFRFKLPSDPFNLFELNGRVVGCEKRTVKDQPDTLEAGFSTHIEFLSITDKQKQAIREYVNWFLGKQGTKKKEGGAK